VTKRAFLDRILLPRAAALPGGGGLDLGFDDHGIIASDF
jgi:hypothetical protein